MEKLKKLQKKLTAPILVADKNNLLYLLDKPVMDGFLLLTKNDAIFFGNGLEKISGTKTARLSDIARFIKGKTLLIEDCITIREQQFLKKFSKSIKLQTINGLVEELRLYKDKDELSMMKSAYDITVKVFSRIKISLAEKKFTELALARQIKIWGLELGVDDVSFEPIVASGVNAAIPHHMNSNKVIKSGECVVLDFGFKVNGYCSDFTSTVFIKSASKQLKTVYNHIENAYQLSVESLKSGIAAAEPDVIARNYLAQNKLEKYFTHSLGHGTGLAVHESPYLYKTSKDVLQDGYVFSIEPGVYIDGVGGVRIEDLVYLQNGKAKYFAKVSTKLEDNIIK